MREDELDVQPLAPQQGAPWAGGRAIAYLSMEVALESHVPTYAGGLGVLAGDTLRAAADLGLPVVAVSLVYRQGYFRQRLSADGDQREEPHEWKVEDVLEPLPQRVAIRLSGRTVTIRAWRYRIRGLSGLDVPVYLLDTDLPENEPEDRSITDWLYGGDGAYRLGQEAVLGLGGIAMLRALGYQDLAAYHLNEGHSALLTMALLREAVASPDLERATAEEIEAVRNRCVFTTHTPVPAGHDQFPVEVARQVLGEELVDAMKAIGACLDGSVNMTHLALFFSRYINGVAMRHSEISRGMFPGYPVNSITNGVHAETWVSQPFQHLFDRHMPEWRRDNFALRHALGIPLDEIEDAHRLAKQALLAYVCERSGVDLDPDVLTLGFARRATPYKRPALLYADIERLRYISRSVGRLQVLYAGKAHPRDEAGKAAIREIFTAARALGPDVPVVYLEDYDMETGRYFCSGVDLWLNTPQPTLEASGTSGMKAALNGVPSFSVIDGWWVEGHIEGVTGWSIGPVESPELEQGAHAAELYERLERTIVPMFYEAPGEFTRIGRWAISLNGSFFNAQRMVHQYATSAYRIAAAYGSGSEAEAPQPVIRSK